MKISSEVAKRIDAEIIGYTWRNLHWSSHSNTTASQLSMDMQREFEAELESVKSSGDVQKWRLEDWFM